MIFRFLTNSNLFIYFIEFAPADPLKKAEVTYKLHTFVSFLLKLIVTDQGVALDIVLTKLLLQ